MSSRTPPLMITLKRLELTTSFVGGLPHCGANFGASGPVHLSCRMSKLLHALKIWMFGKQLSLTSHHSRGRNYKRTVFFCFFLQYVQVYIEAPHEIEARCRNLALPKPFFNFPTKQFPMPHSKRCLNICILCLKS